MTHTLLVLGGVAAVLVVLLVALVGWALLTPNEDADAALRGSFGSEDPRHPMNGG
jgi:hypothetical protein